MIEKLKSILRKIKTSKPAPVTEQSEIYAHHYKSYNVYYSKGTSLITRVLQDGDYEPEISALITEQLSAVKSPLVIDVGANIGLMSLSILHSIPDAKIYAFEPGPHQFKLFGKTIQENKLGDKIVLSSVALSNKKGVAEFQVHSSEDASGDGFFDTERAGSTKGIQVQTDTLDNWWIANGKPKVDFIKMDTEGAEYWILHGGKQMIDTCRPAMVAEIFEQNIKNYPYTMSDVIGYIREIGYAIQTPEKEEVNDDNLAQMLKKENTFLLIPLSR